MEFNWHQLNRESDSGLKIDNCFNEVMYEKCDDDATANMREVATRFYTPIENEPDLLQEPYLWNQPYALEEK